MRWTRRRSGSPPSSSATPWWRPPTAVGLTWNCSRNTSFSPAGTRPKSMTLRPLRCSHSTGSGSNVLIVNPSNQPGSNTSIGFSRSRRGPLLEPARYIKAPPPRPPPRLSRGRGLMACSVTITSVSGSPGPPLTVTVDGTATDCDTVRVYVRCPFRLLEPQDVSVVAGAWSATFPNADNAGCACGESVQVHAECVDPPPPVPCSDDRTLDLPCPEAECPDA